MNTNLTSPTFSFTYKDLLISKFYYPIICSVLSQLLLLQAYVLISNVNLLHPLQCIVTTFNVFTSITTWCFILPFLTIIFAQSLVCAKDYIVKPTYCSTRFRKVVSVCSLHHLTMVALSVIVGAALTSLCLSLGGGQYQSLVYQCKGHNYCLSGSTFFLTVAGFWTGLYYFVTVRLTKKQFAFPVVYQRKFLQFKVELLPLLKKSFVSSLVPSVYFTVLYYVWGFSLSKGFSENFGLFQEDSGDGIRIYYYLWVFSAVYYFNMNLMTFLFDLFLSEPVQFPLFKQTNDSLCLQDGVNMSDFPIVQNLACLDLHILARWSKPRRQVFYALSQPGGHPYNWNALVENVLKLFTEYTQVLNKSSPDPTKVVPAPPVVENVYQSPKYLNLRNMSSPAHDNIVDVKVVYKPGLTFQFPVVIVAKTKQALSTILTIVTKLLGIKYLFDELPQANVEKCIAKGYLVIWASQGIADIACTSLREDPFGIIQKDLPAIITSMVQLKQSLEKFKLPIPAKRASSSDDFDYKMRNAMISAVRRSLYGICHTFGSYVNEFPLSKEVSLHLQTIYKR